MKRSSWNATTSRAGVTHCPIAIRYSAHRNPYFHLPIPGKRRPESRGSGREYVSDLLHQPAHVARLHPRLPTTFALRRARKKFDLHPLVIHANYLVNLAAADPVIRARVDRRLPRRTGTLRGHRRRIPGPAPGQLSRLYAARGHRGGGARSGKRRPKDSARCASRCCSRTRSAAAPRSARASKSCAPSAIWPAQLTDLPHRLLPRYLPSAGRRLRHRHRRGPGAHRRRRGPHPGHAERAA